MGDDFYPLRDKENEGWAQICKICGHGLGLRKALRRTLQT